MARSCGAKSERLMPRCSRPARSKKRGEWKVGSKALPAHSRAHSWAGEYCTKPAWARACIVRNTGRAGASCSMPSDHAAADRAAGSIRGACNDASCTSSEASAELAAPELVPLLLLPSWGLPPGATASVCSAGDSRLRLAAVSRAAATSSPESSPEWRSSRLCSWLAVLDAAMRCSRGLPPPPQPLLLLVALAPSALPARWPPARLSRPCSVAAAQTTRCGAGAMPAVPLAARRRRPAAARGPRGALQGEHAGCWLSFTAPQGACSTPKQGWQGFGWRCACLAAALPASGHGAPGGGEQGRHFDYMPMCVQVSFTA